MLKAVREYPSRKPLSYHLVTNLAVAEIIGTLCLIFTFVFIYLQYWPFGAFACKVTIPLQVLALFVVTNTLDAIAVYRFLLVVFQLRITVSNCRLILLISLSWLTALVISMPLFVYFEMDTKNNSCSPNFKGDDIQNKPNSKTYEIVRFILNFGLPYLIMVVLYAGVAFKLKRHINSNKRGTVGMSELGDTTKQTQDEEEEEEEEDESTQQQATDRTHEKSSRAITHLEKDLLKMIYVVIIVFAVCYLPYQMYFLFYTFHGFERYPETMQYIDIIQSYCLLLGSLSGALHPLCYGTMRKFYARTFSRLMLCQCK